MKIATSSRLQFFILSTAVCLFLYLHMFLPSGVPIWRGDDQSMYMLHAVRMLRGEVIYRDMFQFNLPGTECLYYLLFRLFGPAAWIVSAVMVVAGTVIVLLTFALAKKVIWGWRAVAAPVAFVVFALQYDLDGTHHWYSMVAVLAALLLIAERRTLVRLCAAGALLAAATLFTSTRGIFAIAGMVAFLVWEFGCGRTFLKAVASLLSPFLLLVGGTMLYLARIASIRLLVESLIIFPLRYYSGDRLVNSLAAFMCESVWFPPWEWRRLPALCSWLLISVGVPLTFVIFFLAYRRNPQAYKEVDRGRTLVLLATIGVSVFLSISSAPMLTRLIPISPLAFLVTFSLIEDCPVISRLAIRAVLVVAVLLGGAFMLSAQIHWHGLVRTPHGPVAVVDSGFYEQYLWIAQHSRANDTFFGSTDFDFLLELENPTPIPYFTADAYTRPEQVRSIIAGLENHRTRFILWSVMKDMPYQYDPATDSLPPLRRYLHHHYQVAKVFSDGTQIWQRTEQR